MNWIGFGTLISREVGRFFSGNRKAVVPGFITTEFYISIFGFSILYLFLVFVLISF